MKAASNNLLNYLTDKELAQLVQEQRPMVNVGIVYLVNKQMTPLHRLTAHEGGTRSGKTYNTIEFLVDEARSEDGLEITIASRDMPHLKKGAIKDFLKIMIRRGIYRDDEWHESNKVYTFPNGSTIEFFNADELGKVSGPGRDILFCNEVNFFKYNIFSQLLRRTRRYAIVDYNPIHPKHWVYDKILTRKDCFMWRSTYLDNIKFLPEEQIYEIELMREQDPIAWQVYGLGLRGQYQKGQIYGQKPYKPWVPISLADYAAVEREEIVGHDWGDHPDPNASIGVKRQGNKRFIRKINYATHQSNKALARSWTANGLTAESRIVADQGHDKDLRELRGMGFPLIYAAVKGKGSIERGIKLINQLETFYVMDPDIEFEYFNYAYLLDAAEEPTGVPNDEHNHLMDAYRYVELFREYL